MKNEFPIALGRRILFEVDPVDASAPDFSRFQGTIDRIVTSEDGYPMLVVRTDGTLHVREDFALERLLAVGIDMNLIGELFEAPKRPRGLPVLAALYRLSDDAAVDRVAHFRKTPPATEFLGRAEVRLA